MFKQLILSYHHLHRQLTQPLSEAKKVSTRKPIKTRNQKGLEFKKEKPANPENNHITHLFIFRCIWVKNYLFF